MCKRIEMKTTQKKNLSESVAIMLRSKIMKGELQANERIIESEVAEAMQVSRGPVREALKILEYEGLVTYETKKGCKVTKLSSEDTYEVFYLRGSLEIMSLKLAGGRISDISLLTMKSYLEEMKKSSEENDIEKMVQWDELFHQEIIRAGNMKRLTKMWESLSPLNGAMFLKVNDTYILREGETWEDVFGEYQRQNFYDSHKILLEKLEDKNLDAAVESLWNHYIKTGERIYKIEARRKLLNKA